MALAMIGGAERDGLLGRDDGRQRREHRTALAFVCRAKGYRLESYLDCFSDERIS
jgi:hypothetical protein